MKRVILSLLLLTFVLIVLGCTHLENLGDYSHSMENEGQTINEYFGENISSYKEITLGGEIDCHNGVCPSLEFKNRTEEKDCYFCDSVKIRGQRLDLIREKWASGSSDFFFGCSTKYMGPYMDGFEIIEQTPEKLVVKGNIMQDVIQKSIHCDKKNDPECDDMTYGNCADGNYNYTSFRHVELVFKK